MTTLSKDQKKALSKIQNWLESVWSNIPKHERKKNTSQHFILAGFAGTGKTTLTATLRKEINTDLKNQKYPFFKSKKKLSIAFCSFTGKASRILNDKLKEQDALNPSDSVSTIHSLIYSAITDQNDQVIGFEKKDAIAADLIIIDEASMLTEKLWRDLLSFRLPVLAIGDHGQLPPIESSFNLLVEPDFVLEQIHRQKEGNPILELATFIRNQGEIPDIESVEFENLEKKLNLKSDSRLQIYSSANPLGKEVIQDFIENYKNDMLILCGYNFTRKQLNNAVRAKKYEHEETDWELIQKFSSEDLSEKEIAEKIFSIPRVGDTVICLKNNARRGIFNGMTASIDSLKSHSENLYKLELKLDSGDVYESYAFKSQFGAKAQVSFKDIPLVDFNTGDTKEGKREPADLFDFGYALTVHKAQGSQAKKVLLFAEKMKKMTDDDWKRWLYTAVTRAEEELVVIV